jgi:hypothetical protein
MREAKSIQFHSHRMKSRRSEPELNLMQFQNAKGFCKPENTQRKEFRLMLEYKLIEETGDPETHSVQFRGVSKNLRK